MLVVWGLCLKPVSLVCRWRVFIVSPHGTPLHRGTPEVSLSVSISFYKATNWMKAHPQRLHFNTITSLKILSPNAVSFGGHLQGIIGGLEFGPCSWQSASSLTTAFSPFLKVTRIKDQFLCIYFFFHECGSSRCHLSFLEK